MALKASDMVKKTGKAADKGDKKSGKSGNAFIDWIGNRRAKAKKAPAGKKQEEDEDDE